ncbi:Predicted Fe-Mo cluster-binding protein, NifX family [Desulfuromusa kysingii]|uniref:Predicted Fe-Mo cluster-binding protein, NifX family n=1 Tax=Desulfuromusa kysingii TaxID=37625 RepID=A0A1H3W8F0_9BACT|nr:NifB/NifX family molybdenum-iron cluster-binding protein [Desulfuromusa kysingii]SDZ83375.1 Predicted Fe-Mo cluster-binding protein, NifX family [Desulfuromusa kysingii]
MLIAITAQENSLQSEIDPRFGRAAYYLIINTETDEVTGHDNSAGINAANGAGTGAAQTLSEYGVEALYTGKVGPKAAEVLNQAKIPYFEDISGTVQDVLDQIKGGGSPKQAIANSNTPTASQTVINPDSDVASRCPGALTGAGRRMGNGCGQGQGKRCGSGRGQGQGRGGCRR